MYPVIDGMRTVEFGGPGNLRQWLVGLVIDGIKSATAGLVAEYENDGEPVEHVGERLVVVDDHGQGVATIEVTRVDTRRLADVDWDFVAAENEGDPDVAHWRAGHEAYWASTGRRVDDDTPVVLVWFTLVDVRREWPVPRVERVRGQF
jgi:uncharacterized protein YhfF